MEGINKLVISKAAHIKSQTVSAKNHLAFLVKISFCGINNITAGITIHKIILIYTDLLFAVFKFALIFLPRSLAKTANDPATRRFCQQIILKFFGKDLICRCAFTLPRHSYPADGRNGRCKVDLTNDTIGRKAFFDAFAGGNKDRRNGGVAFA